MRSLTTKGTPMASLDGAAVAKFLSGPLRSTEYMMTMTSIHLNWMILSLLLLDRRASESDQHHQIQEQPRELKPRNPGRLRKTV